MIRLIEILIESKIVQVPQEILDKLPGIYDQIKNNLENYKKWSPDSVKDPYIPLKFKKILKFKDLANKDISVSVGMYNDPKDAGSGRMDTYNDIMMINLAFFGDKEDFLDLGEHELAHAMDPKVRDQKLFGREYTKKGAEPSGSKLRLSKSNPAAKTKFEKNMEKYLKSPWEFDAFTAPLINTLKKNKKKLNNDQQFKQQVNSVFSALRTKSPEEIADDPNLNTAAYYFSNKEWNEENWPQIKANFEYDMEKIKTWISKPTLYKRFLQRYSKIIN